MIIICLEGPENVGKTSAINEIYKRISEDRSEVIKDKERDTCKLPWHNVT